MAPAPPPRSFASVPIDTEESRAFLQSRLRLLARLMTLLSGGFWLVQLATALLTLPQHASHLLEPSHLFHPAQALFAAALWGALARGAWRVPWLHVADAALTIGSANLLAAGARFDDPAIAFLVSTLGAVMLVVGRAVFIPSTAARTAWIGAASVLPTVAYTALRGEGSHALFQTAYTAAWTSVGVVLSALASRTIFGLRERVREATQLGQYTLLERIGAGGMGEVYRAQHAMLRRPTAVKLLRPESVGEELVRRFEREVRLTARLTHPNTIAIYDYGRSHEGVFYYAMELLDGIDLQRLVDGHGPLPPARVVHVLAQVCASLGEAHALGLIHRDIKPGNVVLCTRGRQHDVVKVLDFGLVKDLRASDELALSRDDAIAGTPLYLSPESIRAPERVDARADLYAVGLLGFFLLTGRPPFAGKNVVEVCAKHLHEVPERPSELARADVPADLDDVVLRCLAKDPDERYESADALRDALLATSVAGAWTEADARAAFESLAARPSEDERSVEERTGVLSIDLAARASPSTDPASPRARRRA